MRKLYRSMLWSGLIVAGAAACGDDVTIPPPPPLAVVRSVSVAPTGAIVAAGGTLQMVATVDADAGTATTVTWSSSDATRASVSATGLVTAAAAANAGSVAITACSTVIATVCGSATVTISASIPVTLSIKSITAGGLGTPVNFNNVFGQIDVTLNLDTGTQSVAGVDVLIGTEVVAFQNFSPVQWEAAVAEALAAQSDATENIGVELVLSFNTAAFNATTGVARFRNGPQQLTARARLAGSTPVATPSTPLIFNNQSGVVANIVSSNGTDLASAVNPATGLQWIGGDVTLNFIGVSYEPGTVGVASVSTTLFGKTSLATLTSGLGSVAFVEGTTWTAGNLGVGNYLSPKAGEQVANATVVLTNGQTLVIPPGGNAILNFNASPSGNAAIPALQTVRLDNVAPGVTPANPDDFGPLLVYLDGIAQTPITIAPITQVWVNATTSFAAGQLGVATLATLNAQNVAAPDIEEGVDAITVTFHATAAGAALPASACSLTGLIPITTGADLAATTVSTSYRVRVVFKDALGNTTCLPLAPGGVAGAQLGADFIAPTVVSVTGPAAGPPGLNVDPGNFAVVVSDNASGFLATPLNVILSRLNVGGTTTCVIGSGTGCVTPAATALTFDATGGPNTEGYYTVTITLVDQAGNQTVVITGRVYEYDVTNPGFTGGISLPALIAGAQTNTFLATATDNLDLLEIFGVVTYPVNAGTFVQYETQSIGTFGPPLETSSAVSYAVANWMRCINAAGSFAVASGVPLQIDLTVSDQALNTSTLASAPFGANAEVCTGAVGNTTINSFIPLATSPNYGTGLTQVDISGTGLAAASSATVTLSVVADVPLNTSVDPFTRVDFYMVVGGAHIKIGTATAVLAQDLLNRTYTYNFVWDPGATVPVGAVTIEAIGVDAQGDAVLSGTQVVTTVP